MNTKPAFKEVNNCAQSSKTSASKKRYVLSQIPHGSMSKYDVRIGPQDIPPSKSMGFPDSDLDLQKWKI